MAKLCTVCGDEFSIEHEFCTGKEYAPRERVLYSSFEQHIDKNKLAPLGAKPPNTRRYKKKVTQELSPGKYRRRQP